MYSHSHSKCLVGLYISNVVGQILSNFCLLVFLKFLTRISLQVLINLLLLTATLLVTPATSAEIDCEKIEINGKAKTCFMNNRTAIRTTSITFYFGVDDSINAISFSFNPKVDFLPIQVDQKFPNVIEYRAANCALRRVMKANFEGLDKLETLRLSGNRIEKMLSDTFDGLLKLKLINLGSCSIMRSA